MTPKQAKPQKVPPKQHTAIFTCTSRSYKRQMTKLMKETLARKFPAILLMGETADSKTLYPCQLFPPLDYEQRRERCPRDQTCKF